MLVQIVNGTYGHRPKDRNGKLCEYVVPTTRNDPPIEVEDMEAERLIAAGIAVSMVHDHQEEDVENQSLSEAETQENSADNLDTDPDEEDSADDEAIVFSVKMKADELRAAMQERGLTVRVGMTKADMVEALNGKNDIPVLEAEGVIDE